MGRVERFSISMDKNLLEVFDQLIEDKRYSSRSEAIRDLVRKEIVSKEWASADSEVAATITIIYDHHENELSAMLPHVQHDFFGSILCTTHVHLDHHNCMEVIILKGKSSDIKELSDRIFALKGVKHGQITHTLPGKFFD